MKHLVVVLTEPSEGQEEEFNDYYENLHLDEVIKTTGWETAQRFKLVDEQGRSCPLPYLALYEVESENSEEILQGLNATRGERKQSKSLNKKTAGVWVFAETGPKHGNA